MGGRRLGERDDEGRRIRGRDDGGISCNFTKNTMNPNWPKN